MSDNSDYDIEDAIEDNDINDNISNENFEENNEISTNSINELNNNRINLNDIIRKKKDIQIPDLNNSIELINYFETKYYLTQIDENESELNKNKFNYEPFQTILKENLFSKINDEKKENKITFIKLQKDNLYIGYSSGIIKIFSLRNESGLNNLNINSIGKIINKEIKVTCIDISNDSNYLLCGYSNGWIILWDLKTNKDIKVFSEEHFKYILYVKLINCDGKNCTFYSSDISGKVNKIIMSKKLFFNVSVTCNNLINDNNNIYYKIEILNLLNDNEKKIYKIPNLIAFVSQKKIVFYQIDNNNSIFNIEENDYNNNNCYSDFCFGKGYLPRQFSYQKKKRIDYNEIALKNDFDMEKEQILLLVTFGNKVKVYCLRYNDNKNFQLILTGYYHNDCDIIKINFLLNSILFIFDINNNLTILNTGFFSPNLLEKNLENSNTYSILSKKQYNLFKPNEYYNLFEEFTIIQKKIQSNEENKQNKEEENINKKNKKPPLISILGENNLIIIITNEFMIEGKLLSYDKEYIRNIQEKNDWIEGIKLGIDIYSGNKNSFLNLPINEDKRKKEISNLLKELIIQYINSNLNETIFCHQKDNLIDLISDYIKKSIDLCLKIESQNFLFNNILRLFEQKNCLLLFIYNLEPYFLRDQIKEEIDNEIVIKIIKFYISKQEMDLLSQILIHININSLQNESIKNICEENKLITPLIYIYMNGKEKNYKSALELINESFKSSNLLKEINLILSYKDIPEKISISKLVNSKQYIGILILWYINLCIKGINFQTNTIIEEKDYIQTIQQFFIWLIQDTYFEIFIEIDSLSFYYVLSMMFLSNKAFNSISSIEFKGMLFEGMKLNKKSINEYNFLSLIKSIIEKGKENKDFWVSFDFYCFIIEISKKHYVINNKKYINLIEKEDVIEGIKFLLNYLCNIDNNEKENKNFGKDLFGFHSNIDKYKINYLSKVINETINNYIDNFEKEEILEILKHLKNDIFFNLKINLLERVEEYNECLEIYLKEYNEKNKCKNIFNFIEKTLKILKETRNNESLNLFKNKILAHIIDLSKLSNKSLYQLILIWFNNNQKLVIDILEKEDKLNYIEYILNDYKEEDLIPGKQEYQLYLYLLPIQIELLCKLGKENEVLDNLKKRFLYPEKCIEICQKYNLKESEIFLLQRNLKFENAIQISLKTASNEFLYMVNENKYNEDSENKFYKFLNISTDVCESAQSISNEQFWDELIKEINNLRNYFQNKYQGEYKEKLSEIIKNGIEKIYEKMFSFFDIRQILNFTLDSKNAEFKDYRKIFINIMNNYIETNRILGIIKKLSSLSTNKNIKDYKEEKKKGNFYKIIKCDVCGKNFDYNIKNNIELFHCGHLMHFSCCIHKDDKVLCKICNSEINDEEEEKGDNNINNSNKKENSPFFNIFNIKVNERIKRINLQKIKRLDKQFFDEGLFN